MLRACRTIVLCLAAFGIFPASLLWAAVPQSRVALGWVENTRVYPSGLLIRAKLDSGAERSSLHAENINFIMKEGRQWVRFDISGGGGRVKTIERPVVGYTRIKRHGKRGRRRVVVNIGVCLANIFKQEEVSLENRNKFEYDLLIGRSFLAGNALVDSSATITTEPSCDIPEKRP